MQFKVTRLKIQKPRKGELWMRGSQSHGTSAGVQTVRAGDGDHSLTTKGRSQTSGDTTVGNGFTLNPVGGVTNYEYESNLNEDKRNITVLRPSYLDLFLSDMRKIMTYSRSSQFISNKVIRTENTRNTDPN